MFSNSAVRTGYLVHRLGPHLLFERVSFIDSVNVEFVPHHVSCFNLQVYTCKLKQLSVFAGKMHFSISIILKIDAVVQLFTASFGLLFPLYKPLKLCVRARACVCVCVCDHVRFVESV